MTTAGGSRNDHDPSGLELEKQLEFARDLLIALVEIGYEAARAWRTLQIQTRDHWDHS